MAGALQIEQRRGVFGVLKDIGRRLIDRHRASAGDGVGMLTGMQAQRFKRGWLWRGHFWDLLIDRRRKADFRFCHKMRQS